MPAYSSIDYFVGSNLICRSTTEASVIHNGDNPSNHSPIYTKLDVGQFSLEVEKIQGQKRVNWSKATDVAIENYKLTVTYKLDSIVVPECHNCTDLYCTANSDLVEVYTMSVLESVETAAKECPILALFFKQ